MWKHEHGISKSKKTEHPWDQQSQATGSEPLQKLELQFSRYECNRSGLSIQRLRNIRAGLVNQDRNIVSLRHQLPVAALYDIAIVLFRFDY
jgi:hypothetical protein